MDLVMSYEGMDIVFGLDNVRDKYDNPFPVFNHPSKINVPCDVIIDFSKPEGTNDLVQYCIEKEVPIVIATTGLSPEQDLNILEAATRIPIFKSSNTSIGVNVLLDLVKMATRVLSDEFDIEIIEKHHNKKVDAPSGTAYMIANAINDELNEVMTYNYGRNGKDAQREEKEIGIHAVRGGTIPGEHTVIFAGLDEIIEIKHTALSKKIFAKQAINVAQFIVNKEPKLYNMNDYINQH